MYNVRVSKTIWESNPTDKSEDELVAIKVAMFRKNIILPFVPFPGLTIAGRSWEPETIESVIWDIDQESFGCPVEDMFAGWVDDTHLSFDDLINLQKRMAGKRLGNSFFLNLCVLCALCG